MTIIDKHDCKLLHELRMNCRQSNTQLAKSTGLSKQRVNYRINRLVREGVLDGKVLRIDAGRLGYHNYGVYFQWDDDAVKDHFVKDLLMDRFARYAAECSGRIDFVVSFYAKTPTEFRNMWDRYSARYGASIRRHFIYVSTENRAFDKAYLLNEPGKRTESFLGSPEVLVDIDEVDTAILKVLEKDCKTSIISIAKSCSIVPETVKQRIRRMEGTGLIQGYGWLFNKEPLNLSIYEVLLSLRNMNPAVWVELLAYCRSNPNIVYYIRSIGSHDLDIVFEVGSDMDFDRQLHNLRKRFAANIQEFEIVKIVKEHLFRYAPFL